MLAKFDVAIHNAAKQANIQHRNKVLNLGTIQELKKKLDHYRTRNTLCHRSYTNPNLLVHGILFPVSS